MLMTERSHEGTRQSTRRTGHLDGRGPEPEIGPNDVLIRSSKTAICGTDMHIYNWDEWAQKTIPVPMAIGHEFAARSSRSAARCAGFETGRSRLRRRPHHLRLLPQLPRRPPPPVPQHGRRRRQPAGLLRRVPRRFPAVNAFKLPDEIDDDVASILDPFGNATHTALVVRPRRRGRADHRRRPDRHHGRRHRRSSARATSSSPTSTTTGSTLARSMGATRAINVTTTIARRRDEGARHEGGLRRRPRDVRQRAAFRDMLDHEPRRQHRAARHPADRDRRSTGTRSSSRAW